LIGSSVRSKRGKIGAPGRDFKAVLNTAVAAFDENGKEYADCASSFLAQLCGSRFVNSPNNDGPGTP
jgi:hypothetical protein